MAGFTKSNYAQQLLDPQWQKKRLRIFERDKWRCRKCNAGDKTLHVHHMHYINGRRPWEYPDDTLLTLCADCHENEGEAMQDALETLICACGRRGMTGLEIGTIARGIGRMDSRMASLPAWLVARLIYFALTDADTATHIARQYGQHLLCKKQIQDQIASEACECERGVSQ